MGYYSALDLEQRENEWGTPTKSQQLSDRLCYLNERLIDLEELCPRNMMDPSFDRWFYSECASGASDDLCTVQGVLQAIRRTEERLLLAEEEEQRELEEQQRRMAWRAAVRETGATPDHQIVLLDAFFPAEGRSAAA